MTPVALTEADAQSAEALWAEYGRSHEVSAMAGQTVGIEPETGRMWFGESIRDVVRKRDAAGVHRPLHFIRVGSASYYRKGTRR